MAAPTFVAAGAGVATTGTSLQLQTGAGNVGDLVIAHILADGIPATNPTPPSSGGGFENLAGTASQLTQVHPTANGFTVGATPNGRHYLWVGRMTSALSQSLTFTVNGTIDHFGRAYRFTGVNTGTALSDVFENDAAGDNIILGGGQTGTTVSDVIVTTFGADRLALNFVSIMDDASGLAAFAGESGGDWALAVAIFESSTGTDATLGLMTATLASQGTIDGGSDTIVSLPWGVIGTALKPATTADADAEVSWAEFEVPSLNASAQIAWAEVEVPTANSRADVSFGEFEVPTLNAAAQVSWAEFEVPFLNAQAEVAFGEVEIPFADSRADIAWAEVEVPFADARADVAWAEFEVTLPDARSDVAWAEVEVPLADSRADIAWCEFEVPTTEARADISFAEFEISLVDSRADIAWAEVEIPFVDAQAHISWAELELPFAEAAAFISFGEIEVPTANSQAQVSWCELEVPNVGAIPGTALSGPDFQHHHTH